MEKTCTGCQQVLLLEDFYKSKREPMGVRSQCKRCEKQKYIDNKEEILKRQHAYYRNNKKDIRERRKKHYYDNIDKELEQRRGDYRKHKEKRDQSAKKWAKDNPDGRKRIMLKSYLKHKEKYKKQTQEKYKNDPAFREKRKQKTSEWKRNNKDKVKESGKRRLKNNPQAKMIARLRKRTNDAVKRLYESQKKTSSFYKLTGCDNECLIKYLESKFYDSRDGVKMTWENHGPNHEFWQIDHIIPCFSFDLSKPEQQFQCFHFSNLQPLWFDDHVEKTNKDKAIYTNNTYAS